MLGAIVRSFASFVISDTVLLYGWAADLLHFRKEAVMQAFVNSDGGAHDDHADFSGDSAAWQGE